MSQVAANTWEAENSWPGDRSTRLRRLTAGPRGEPPALCRQWGSGATTHGTPCPASELSQQQEVTARRPQTHTRPESRAKQHEGRVQQARLPGFLLGQHRPSAAAPATS